MPVNGNIQFSRGLQQQTRTPATSQEDDSSTATGDEQGKGTAQAEETLPPFPVLLQWLEFYHSRTGFWPHPELLEKAAPGSAAERPLLTLLPASKVSNNELPGNSNCNRKQPSARNTKQNGKDRAASELEKEPEKPLDNKGNKEEYLLKVPANFNLKTSIYYRAALDLLQNGSTLPFAANFSLASPSGEELVLTLASFLALCCLSASESKAGDQKAAPTMEMYLSLDRWSRFLKMRKATLGRCLKELAQSGLLEIASGNNAGSEDLNSKKNGNRVYRLAVPLREQLPALDLWQNLTGEAPSAGAEPQSQTGELPLKQFQVVEPAPTGETNREPVAMSHASNLKFKNQKNTKHDRKNPDKTGTGDTFEEKLLFLLETASFPGYTSPEGLVTLDKKQAQKFAADPQLNLTSIKKIYQQVLASWSAGKCTRNPIGLFHYSLTRHLKQPGPCPAISAGNHLPEQVTHFQGTGSPVNQGTSFRQPSTLHNQKNRKPYGNITKDPDLLSDATVWNSRLEETAAGSTTNPKNKPVPDLSKAETNAQLQKHVIEALQNRFRQPTLAGTLSNLDWSFSLSENKVHLELQNNSSQFLAVSRLSQSELSLIKIALSQGLRALTGSSLEIDVALATTISGRT